MEHIGNSFDNPTLWDWKSQDLYGTDFDLLSDTVKEDKVKEDVKQAFLADLFFINSNNKKHSQLKKTVANDHAKGDGEAFPSSCHAALTLMNDFKPLVVKATAQIASQGTAFAKKQKGAGTAAASSECSYEGVICQQGEPQLWQEGPSRQMLFSEKKARQRWVLMIESQCQILSLIRQSSL